jgi:hypothetical protein
LRQIILGAALGALLTLAQGRAAEPLAGTWLLKSQEVAGQKNQPESLTLRIFKSGNGFEFAYSVPVNNIQFVSMQFTSRLDGTDADVKDAQGNKVGSIKINHTGPSEYSVKLEGTNRPTATGKMTVSGDGKTLTSESESNVPGRGPVHTLQVFARQ